MASYHFSAQPVKRSEGRSVVAMAAYRAGARLKDERRGLEIDYRRRRGVVHAEILAPDDAAVWLLDREALWNAVERMEVRRDAQLAREINMALPHELNDDQRLALVRKFVGEQFVALGMVADVAIHAPVPEKGDDPRNFHAHVLLTMRQAGGGGLRRVKTRAWNSDKALLQWRAAWANYQNEALRSRGHAVRVDHRSLAARKRDAVQRGDRKEAAILDRAPEIHVGPKAKKASLGKSPISRDKAKGRNRKHVIRYTEIDQGTRGERNIARLSANARKLEVRLRKVETLAARFKKRTEYYERQTHHQASSAARESVDKRLHALRRLQQIAWLIYELDLLFFQLLHIRESQLARRTMWSNRLARQRGRAFEPSSGGRSRRRI
ncbi:MobQ family relaxase [Bradyrhizobium cenepequi]